VLGARCGLASEVSFRAAVKGILEKSFGVEVINVSEFDDELLCSRQPMHVDDKT
jgi:hypothetical protein